MTKAECVKNVDYDYENFRKIGICPHCGEKIDDWGLDEECPRCTNPILWDCTGKADCKLTKTSDSQELQERHCIIN